MYLVRLLQGPFSGLLGGGWGRYTRKGFQDYSLRMCGDILLEGSVSFCKYQRMYCRACGRDFKDGCRKEYAESYISQLIFIPCTNLCTLWGGGHVVGFSRWRPSHSRLCGKKGFIADSFFKISAIHEGIFRLDANLLRWRILANMVTY